MGSQYIPVRVISHSTSDIMALKQQNRTMKWRQKRLQVDWICDRDNHKYNIVTTRIYIHVATYLRGTRQKK